jgi:hypothetical protein
MDEFELEEIPMEVTEELSLPADEWIERMLA